jgi:hypothetical protein
MLGMRSLCQGFGWWLFLAPASSSDSRGGTAVLIKQNSTEIKLTNNSNFTFTIELGGRLAAAEVEIMGHTTWLASIYINASADKRKATLLALI